MKVSFFNSSEPGPGPIPDDVAVHCTEDVDMARLSTQLSMLPELLTDHNRRNAGCLITKVTKIATIVDVLSKAGVTAGAYSEVNKLLRLYLTVPMTNATAERSFSTLRRVKTYLRSTMTEKHLNHVIFLNIHKNLKC